MKPIVTTTAGLALMALAAFVLSACGSSSGSSASSSSVSSKPASSSSNTVSLKSVSVGTVLVDSKGFALYSPDQESNGTIHCTSSCTAIWVPLTLAKGTSAPTADSSLMSKLGTVMRPGGESQVTYNGKPLYRFAQDSAPGKVTGNGASDSFGGTSFTWHVASTGTTAPSSGGGGGGYHY